MGNSMHTSIDSRPEENCDILMKLLSPAKDKNLPTNVVEFNRNRHTKATWMKIHITTIILHLLLLLIC